MNLRKAAKSKRVWIGGVLLAALLAAGLTIASIGFSAPRSPFAECMHNFSQEEKTDGPQWLKEKIESQENECRYRADLDETIGTPQQEKEDKERLVRAHKAAESIAESSPPERSTGIDNGSGGGPPHEPAFTATGSWVGSVDGKWYVVWAGARTEPSTGSEAPVESAVVVELQPQVLGSAETDTYVGTYGDPAAGGTLLTITAAHEGVLTLSTSTGQTLSFDIASHTFSE